ncbi:MAG: LytTR family DNA-binding domain-containing protein [Bacteroidota bacterium]
MNIVIIEDELLIADALEQALLHADADIRIQAKLRSVQEALDYFSEANLPDLFFSDIQLTDGLSFEIFQQLQSAVPVIFCTAYDDYALEAFRQNGIDYLLKPFDQDQILKTLKKYKALRRTHPIPKLDPEKLLAYFGVQTPSRQTNLLVYKGDRIVPVKMNHISVIYKIHQITYLVTFDRKRFVVDQNLNTLETQVGSDFFRVNRQFIVHRDAVKEVIRHFGRKLIVSVNVELKNQILVSKARAPIFLKWLENQ